MHPSYHASFQQKTSPERQSDVDCLKTKRRNATREFVCAFLPLWERRERGGILLMGWGFIVRSEERGKGERGGKEREREKVFILPYLIMK